MKKILLLGDSIRQNYQDYVKSNLKDVATVFYPNDNGKFCYVTLRYLHEWMIALSDNEKIDFDIVHFNCGLWDVLRLSNEERCFTEKEEYAILLKRIVERIRFLCPNATIIFALTTNVKEPGFTAGIKYGERKNKDILEYNNIAKQVFQELNIEVNDLFCISSELPDEARSDQVHFATKMGIEALGNRVIQCLRKYCE